RFAESGEDGNGVGMIVQRGRELIRSNRVAVSRLDRHDVNSKSFSERSPALAPPARCQENDLFTRRDGVDDGGLHASGARGRQNADVIDGLKDILQIRDDLTVQRAELRAAVEEDRLGEFEKRLFRNGGWAGREQSRFHGAAY